MTCHPAPFVVSPAAYHAVQDVSDPLNPTHPIRVAYPCPVCAQPTKVRQSQTEDGFALITLEPHEIQIADIALRAATTVVTVALLTMSAYAIALVMLG